MKLIADSGSTKTDWACLQNNGTCTRFTSAGYNPNYVTAEYMAGDIFKSLPAIIDADKVSDIYFYGAGVTELQFPFIRGVLQRVFPVATIFVAMDLLGSARALLGNSPGFVAILGTGTNSCLYDGKQATMNIDSLGFILGDEGSGGYLGKRLIIDFIRHNIPETAYTFIKDKIHLTGDEIIDQIYTKPFPNRWCAQFAPFIEKHLDDNYFMQLVHSSFEDLFRNIISHYPDYQSYEFNCVGSIAWCFHNILSDVATSFGMKIGKLVRYPIDGLIKYHCKY